MLCVFPQCERFVEQHTPQLLALVPRSQDPYTTCQVCAPLWLIPGLSSAPTVLPSMAHDPQGPHLLDSGSLGYRSVPIEEASVSEQQRK